MLKPGGADIFWTPSPCRLIELRGKGGERVYWLEQLRSEERGRRKNALERIRRKTPLAPLVSDPTPRHEIDLRTRYIKTFIREQALCTRV